MRKALKQYEKDGNYHLLKWRLLRHEAKPKHFKDVIIIALLFLLATFILTTGYYKRQYEIQEFKTKYNESTIF